MICPMSRQTENLIFIASLLGSFSNATWRRSMTQRKRKQISSVEVFENRSHDPSKSSKCSEESSMEYVTGAGRYPSSCGTQEDLTIVPCTILSLSLPLWTSASLLLPTSKRQLLNLLVANLIGCTM